MPDSVSHPYPPTVAHGTSPRTPPHTILVALEKNTCETHSLTSIQPFRFQH